MKATENCISKQLRIDFTEEIWKDIKGEECKYPYQISNYGRVRRLKDKEYKILVSSKNNCGYMLISLILKTGRRSLYVHRLVLNAFKPTSIKMEVNHLDGDRTNNKLENLEWVNRRENNYHRVLRSKPSTSSKYVNVYFHKKRKKYIAAISYKNKKLSLGEFNHEDDAFSAVVEFHKSKELRNKYAQ